MQVVETMEQLARNISALEHARASASEGASYRRLIQNGRCFFPYVESNEVRFAPSRFIGYVDNTIEAHNHHEEKDGKRTNPAINKVAGGRPIENGSMEARYLLFCQRLKLDPSPKVKRKYWFTPDIKEELDQTELRKIALDPALGATERLQLAKARIGQGVFRDKLLRYWKHCALTGCAVLPVLKASHIKPWCDSNNSERLDPFNGLLLSPNVDALFDNGLISFGLDGKLIISTKIDKKCVQQLVGPSKTIGLAKEHAPYLEWHRENRLQK